MTADDPAPKRGWFQFRMSFYANIEFPARDLGINLDAQTTDTRGRPQPIVPEGDRPIPSP
jgi:hypothetical protein